MKSLLTEKEFENFTSHKHLKLLGFVLQLF